MEPFVLTRHLQGIFVIEMNRPMRKNAMDTAMLRALIGALELEASAAVVITGGLGVFSSGADVSEQVDADGANLRMRLFCDLYELVTTCPKPVVAAIDGPCIGGGAEVAGACDLRVGTPQASIRFPGALFGIPVGAARLTRLIGLSHAKDLLMTSRTIDGEEALRMGFLNRLVASEALEKEAVELALSMAGNPGAGIQKQMIDESAGLTAALRAENRAIVRWQRSAQHLRGAGGVAAADRYDLGAPEAANPPNQMGAGGAPALEPKRGGATPMREMGRRTESRSEHGWATTKGLEPREAANPPNHMGTE